MPTTLPRDHPCLIIRRAAYERAGIVRAALDERLGLTDNEFRVDGGLIIIGPIHDAEAIPAVVADLEAAGLAWFDDFFDLSGAWPPWLWLVAMSGDDA
jgi:hypothetical protein